MNTLPDAFVERMSRQLGNELPDFLRALEEPPVRGIRMNPGKPFIGDDVYRAGDRIPWERNGFLLSTESTAGATIYHEAGAFYLQEPAAMLPGRLMDAKPGERILDLCAAPGGKATQMGSDMMGKGLLVCNEPVYKRAQILSRNIERMGISNSVVICSKPEEIAARWGEIFDGVLVDAPCSGEGMFRREPETRKEWTEEQTVGCVKRQKGILDAASRLVQPGGRLVYSTCTYDPAENEGMVAWFLQHHPEFTIEEFPVHGIAAENGLFFCYPHRIHGEGQFAVRLRKKGEKQFGAAGNCSLPGADRETLRIMKESFPGFPEATHRIGNILVRMPECPDLRGITVLRAGLLLAQIKGKIMIPDHAIALSVHDFRLQSTDVNADEACRYIIGEEIPGEASGWVLVQFAGLSLGWGKGSNGVIKNHYPKGLRRNVLI